MGKPNERTNDNLSTGWYFRISGRNRERTVNLLNVHDHFEKFALPPPGNGHKRQVGHLYGALAVKFTNLLEVNEMRLMRGKEAQWFKQFPELTYVIRANQVRSLSKHDPGAFLQALAADNTGYGTELQAVHSG